MAPSRSPLLVNRIRLNSRPVSHPFRRTRLLHLNKRKLIQDSPCSHNATSLPRTQTYRWQQSLRLYSTSETLEPPDHLDDREQKVFRRLRDALDPVSLQVYHTAFHHNSGNLLRYSKLHRTKTLTKLVQVQDISGGCGTMYAVAITTEKFRGLPVIKQHRLVNEVLSEQIKSWHGMQLKTKVP